MDPAHENKHDLNYIVSKAGNLNPAFFCTRVGEVRSIAAAKAIILLDGLNDHR